jgi:capsid portal protein
VVIRESTTAERYHELPTNYPLLGLRTPGTVRDRHRGQQQAKADGDPAPGRVSRPEPPGEVAAIMGLYAEPPFDLDTLAGLLFESHTYFAVVDQFALDAASGWRLVDTEEGAPEGTDIAPTALEDTAADAQRAEAERLLDSMTRDFDDQHIPVSTFSQLLIKDYDSTGQAHIEIVRDDADLPTQLIHVLARLVRRGFDGTTFAQLDELGRPAAFFRRFGAEVAPLDPSALAQGRIDTDTPWAYISREEAIAVAAGLPHGAQLQKGQRFGDLKRELVDFKHYHPAERYYGIPPIVAALNSLVGNILASNRNIRFFINRGVPDYVVFIKAPTAAFANPDSKSILDGIQHTIEDHMRYMIEGDDQRTMTLKVPIEQVEIVFEKLGGEPKDQEWADYQQTNRDNIIHVYRMLPSKLGIIETASLGTGSGETQDETYKRSQIEPRQEMLEAFWNIILDLRLLPMVRFQYNEYDTVDELRDAQIVSVLASTGALSINDIRAAASRIVKNQDFPPDPDPWASMPTKLVDLKAAVLMAGGDDGSEQGVGVAATAGSPGARRLLGSLTEAAGRAAATRERSTTADQLGQLRAGVGTISERMRSDRRRLAPPVGANGGPAA